MFTYCDQQLPIDKGNERVISIVFEHFCEAIGLSLNNTKLDKANCNIYCLHFEILLGWIMNQRLLMGESLQ